jgi:hypothetical protein
MPINVEQINPMEAWFPKGNDLGFISATQEESY